MLKQINQLFENKQIFEPINNSKDKNDNGWIFKDKIDPCIFDQNYIVRNLSFILYSSYFFYELYKENNLLDLFFSRYYNYLGFTSCIEEDNYKKIIYKKNNICMDMSRRK